MKQNDAPVAVPSHLLVGTSTNGERRPPWTLPNSSSRGAPFSTRIGAACGGARPSRTHKSRFWSAALKWIELGNRLRGPSLHSIGGTARPALMMSAGAAEEKSSSGGAGGVVKGLCGLRVPGAGNLVMALLMGRRAVVGPAGADAAQVVRLRHD